MAKRYTFEENKITAQAIDGFYLWLAFLGTGGNVTIHKASAFDPDSIYYDFDITGDEVTEMLISGSYLYGTLDDSSYIAVKINKTNPLGNITYASIPAGITERAVDLTTDGTYIYLLIPGSASGTNAKILKVAISNMSLSSTFDLSQSGEIINDASSIAYDSGNTKLWVITDESPSKLVEVDPSTGVFDSRNLS